MTATTLGSSGAGIGTIGKLNERSQYGQRVHDVLVDEARKGSTLLERTALRLYLKGRGLGSKGAVDCPHAFHEENGVRFVLRSYRRECDRYALYINEKVVAGFAANSKYFS